jgi:hypothetical protein
MQTDDNFMPRGTRWEETAHYPVPRQVITIAEYVDLVKARTNPLDPNYTDAVAWLYRNYY